MATADKERQVIHRAVRVLDEIESRIHELREELEANGMTSPKRGRKKADDEQGHDEDHESQTQGRAKGKGGDENLHGAAKAAHDAKHNEGDGHEDHPNGRGKGKSGDEGNLHGAAKAAHDSKANNHDDHEKGRAKADAKHDDAKHDDDREPHGQGRVKHPETDKRLKGHKDDDDAKAEKAEPAHKG